MIHGLNAVLAWVEKDYSLALAQNSVALELYQKYSGKAGHFASSLSLQGFIQADSKDVDAARDTLDELRGLPENVSGVWPDLLNLYITVRQEGVGSAQQIYQDSVFPKQAIEKQLMPSYFLNQLREDGLQL